MMIHRVPGRGVTAVRGAFTVLAGVLLLAARGAAAQSAAPEPFTRPLPIPPVLRGEPTQDGVRLFRLTVRQGRTEFLPGRESATLGYNGDLLGPTVRVRRGERVRFRVENTLGEATTVHWHGAYVPAVMDGGPHQPIAAGAVWEPEFEIRQPAATLWYHPHPMGATAEQVYRGLAGLLIVDDEQSDRPDLPGTYGVDDIPLILQERRFLRDGSLVYDPVQPDIVHGFFGSAVLANGALQPRLEVGAGWTRFRLLNGGNSSLLRISFRDGSGSRTFHQIASDGGFLERPVAMNRIVLSPGERAEVLVDLSAPSAGGELILTAESNSGREFPVLRLEARPEEPKAPARAGRIPDRLTRLPPVRVDGTEPVRRFVLSTMGPGGALTINGRRMDMRRVDERVPVGVTEVWEVDNASMGMGGRRSMGGMMSVPHSFHIHGLQFRILDLNGRAPPEAESGWKDTVLLRPGDVMRLVVRFEEYTGLYMFHCHLLEHEDVGMMGQFEVYERR